jgi:hypothetical protein
MKTKQTQWKKILVRTSLWLAAEIVLNFVGLDNLADYSEFVFEKSETIPKEIVFLG